MSKVNELLPKALSKSLGALNGDFFIIYKTETVVFISREIAQKISSKTKFVEISLTKFKEVILYDQESILVTDLENNFELVQILVKDDQKNIIDKKINSQRLELLGLLAGGIAHDFNNVLTGILGHTTYLKRSFLLTREQEESFQAIEEGVKQAALMTQQILKVSKKETKEEFDVIDLNESCRKNLILLKGAIGPRYKLHLKTSDKKLNIYAAEGKLAQIITNLVINAKDASKVGGEIHIITENNHNNSSVNLIVKDFGVGINEEMQRKIFQPFFTTKGEMGTGLGLTNVRKLVSELKGELSLESKVGKGTSFIINFPLSNEEETQTIDLLEAKKGEERILIVDDEDSVRNVLNLGLKHLGYKVTAVNNGEDAVTLYKKAYEKNESYDIVLLDMLMPGISGSEVYKELIAMHPEGRFILMSGFVSDSIIEDLSNYGPFELLNKPFSIETLSQAIREALVSL